MKRKLSAVAALCLLTLLLILPAQATEQPADGWTKQNGQYYYYENGCLVTDRWVKEGTKWCYVDEDGHLVRSTWLKDKGKWCYVDKAGYLVTKIPVLLPKENPEAAATLLRNWLNED